MKPHISAHITHYPITDLSNGERYFSWSQMGYTFTSVSYGFKVDVAGRQKATASSLGWCYNGTCYVNG